MKKLKKNIKKNSIKTLEFHTLVNKNVDINQNNDTTFITNYWYDGLYLPHFCFHKQLSIVGNCRTCISEFKKAPKPITSCTAITNPGADEKDFYHDSPYAKKSWEGVMEFLLRNHPLDCPICDQGGVCDLQDLSFYSGTGKWRFYIFKRFVEDKSLGPIVKAIMTRCIHCTRCIRFYQEMSDYSELEFAIWNTETEVGAYLQNIPLLSELSGNTISICPVGSDKINELQKKFWCLWDTIDWSAERFWVKNIAHKKLFRQGDIIQHANILKKNSNFVLNNMNSINNSFFIHSKKIVKNVTFHAHFNSGINQFNRTGWTFNCRFNRPEPLENIWQFKRNVWKLLNIHKREPFLRNLGKILKNRFWDRKPEPKLWKSPINDRYMDYLLVNYHRLVRGEAAFPYQEEKFHYSYRKPIASINHFFGQFFKKTPKVYQISPNSYFRNMVFQEQQEKVNEKKLIKDLLELLKAWNDERPLSLFEWISNKKSRIPKKKPTDTYWHGFFSDSWSEASLRYKKYAEGFLDRGKFFEYEFFVANVIDPAELTEPDSHETYMWRNRLHPLKDLYSPENLAAFDPQVMFTEMYAWHQLLADLGPEREEFMAHMTTSLRYRVENYSDALNHVRRSDLSEAGLRNFVHNNDTHRNAWPEDYAELPFLPYGWPVRNTLDYPPQYGARNFYKDPSWPMADLTPMTSELLEIDEIDPYHLTADQLDPSSKHYNIWDTQNLCMQHDATTEFSYNILQMSYNAGHYDFTWISFFC